MKFANQGLHGEQYAQVMTDGKGMTDFWAMRRKNHTNDVLNHFINTYGVPDWIVSDRAKEEGAGYDTIWAKTERLYHIKHAFTERDSLYRMLQNKKLRM